jgi:hypothetical protein
MAPMAGMKNCVMGSILIGAWAGGAGGFHMAVARGAI